MNFMPFVLIRYYVTGEDFQCDKNWEFGLRLRFHKFSRQQLNLTNCSSRRNHRPLLEMVALVCNGMPQFVYETCFIPSCLKVINFQEDLKCLTAVFCFSHKTQSQPNATRQKGEWRRGHNFGCAAWAAVNSNYKPISQPTWPFVCTQAYPGSSLETLLNPN